ncbi:dihydroorotate dehydrogenase electron transfer subunit [Elusimicrobium posterum]|uniref:dihydroorotate dehydrogenase electron transfer subunit n=1 Tax=Elusimicrobium posterum TaxID=3116653 RepID=UPI003C751F32
MKEILAEILENREVKKDIFNMVLKSDWLAKNAKPGQFIEALAYKDYSTPNMLQSPMLRRPFGIHNADADKGTFEILYKVLGAGTKNLSTKKPGDVLNVIAPLGNGFTIEKDATHFIAGGGMGIAPLLFLAKELEKAGEKPFIFLGARTDEELPCKEKFGTACPVTLTTDDGSIGEKCFLNIPLERALKEAKNPVIYACGPHGMLKCLAELGARYNAKTQLSLEEKMACGIGVCQGCPVELKNKDTKYKSVCKDGPVFNGEDIVW